MSATSAAADRRRPRFRIRRPRPLRLNKRIGPLTRRALTAGSIALAVAALVCTITAAVSDQRAIGAFGAATGLATVLALLLRRTWVGRPMPAPTGRDGLMAAGLTWVAASLFAAIPLLLSGSFPRVADAIFEGTSGITTTGATALVDVDHQPHAVLLWRSLTHWIGGIGIVVLLVAIAPAAGGAARRVLLGESSRAAEETVAPQMRDTARITALIYLTVTGIALIALLLVGLSPWEAVNHAMSVASTGGFSTRTASAGGFESTPVEVALTVLMLASGVSYVIWWRLVTGRGLGIHAVELRSYVLFVIGIGILLAIGARGSEAPGNVFDGIFTAASITTGTGFTTADPDLWGEEARLLVLLATASGAMVGSTTGGFKVRRWLTIFGGIRAEIQRQIAPQRIVVVRIGKKPVTDDAVRAAFGFMAVAFVAMTLGTALLAACGFDLLSAFSGSLACLFNVGPALGQLGGLESYSEVPDGGLLGLSFLMLLGRLELFTILALFTRGLWRAR
ncbi:TrkH family potassium uptake protein [Patulibacter minatonensis]|uniref:TrkH family potassium uptake protein n=1 Tax=Patulibacter minatonensis TaxID=298163 RepID=UPI00047A3FF4|nr:TrkH family potassium uptake protein [Patulibacter minatonensis]